MSYCAEAKHVKLWLNKKNEIFIDAKLNQHQIDGIRFLYKQFQKAKPGVIFNGPKNSGNISLIAEFLNATRNANALHGRPVLIVSNDIRKHEWLELLQNLPQCYNVVLMASHPFVKKSIFIHTMENIEAFTAKDWSVLVVDNDEFITDKTRLAKFKANYKIWLTSLIMQENLKTYEFIYKWIYPKENFQIYDYIPKTNNHTEVLEKTILLDTFMENVLFKRNFVISEVKAIPFLIEPTCKAGKISKVSLKNKDVTGTKIKRSKKLVEQITSQSIEEHADASTSKKTKLDNFNSTPPCDRNTPNEVNHSNMEVDSDISDIESFIQSTKPIPNDFIDKDHDIYHHYVLEDLRNAVKNNENTTNIENFNINNNCEMLPQVSLEEIAVSTDSDDDAYGLETQVLVKDNISVVINDTNDQVKIDDNINEKTAADNIEKAEHIIVNSEDLAKEPQLVKKAISDTDNMQIKGQTLEVTDWAVGNEEQFKNIKNNSKSEVKTNKLDLDSKITEHEDRIFKKFKGTFLDSIF
ncbi:hypothetical protein ACJJTC_003847 [Scirpophaga incertulas]